MKDRIVGNITGEIEGELDPSLVCVILGEELCTQLQNVTDMINKANAALAALNGTTNQTLYDLLVADANRNALFAQKVLGELNASIPKMEETSETAPSTEDVTLGDLGSGLLNEILGKLSPESLSEIQSVLEASGGVQASITEQTKTYTLTYPNGTTQQYTVVTKSITVGETVVDVMFVEEIDKSIAASTSELVFREGAHLTIIRDDPVVAWVFDKLTAGQTIDLSYVVKGTVDKDKTDMYVLTTSVQGAELPCVQEGGTIPVIAKPPVCCAGLTLIPPKEEMILGISGVCTAKCGDGVCDSASESVYNCPADCKGAEEAAGAGKSDWLYMVLALILAALAAIGAFTFKDKLLSILRPSSKSKVKKR